MQWHTQADDITTYIMVQICFNFPGISATKILTWNCHVDGSTNIRYVMILGRYQLTALGLNKTLSENKIKEYYVS